MGKIVITFYDNHISKSPKKSLALPLAFALIETLLSPGKSISKSLST